MLKFLFPLLPARDANGERYRLTPGVFSTGLGTWGLVVAGVGTAVGAGTAMYGANKQSQDNRAANDANIAAQKESERQNWLRFLLTRGVQADPNTQSGEMPTNYKAVNTRLPAWANVITPQSMAATPGAAAPQRVPQLVRISQ